ncbi:MAG: MFS transporter [Candidatus Thorarchaeota archaeon]|nr:MFS transporter [Candidatus Thorarchaeota archaeon]
MTIHSDADIATSETRMPGPYKIVAATSFGVFLSALDASIVNVSLVTMKDSLGVNMDAIQWVVVAYLLIVTSAMPLMGKVGDRLGKTRVFQFGMLVFISGSFLCAISIGLEMLVAARIFQALGASMISANGLALVTYFTTPQNRGRAIGMNSIVLAAALGSGPVLGGFLSQYFGWPSIFLVNLPIGVIGLLVVQVIVPETETVKEVKFDTPGAVLFFAFLFIMIYFFTVIGFIPFGISLLIVECFFIAFLAFLLRESSFPSPIIAVGVLADRRISTSIFSALFAYMAMIPISYLLPFYLQEALGFTQSMTGIFLMVQPIVISVTGPVAGFVSERWHAKYQTVVGLIVQLGGLIFIALAIPNVLFMAIGIAIMGTGLSFFSVANGNFIMTAAPKKYMGVVSALINIARTSGFSIATAMVTTIFELFFLLTNPGGATSGPAFTAGYGNAVVLTIWIFTILVLLAAIISSLRGSNPCEDERRNDEVFVAATNQIPQR